MPLIPSSTLWGFCLFVVVHAELLCPTSSIYVGLRAVCEQKLLNTELQTVRPVLGFCNESTLAAAQTRSDSPLAFKMKLNLLHVLWWIGGCLKISACVSGDCAFGDSNNKQVVG